MGQRKALYAALFLLISVPASAIQGNTTALAGIAAPVSAKVPGGRKALRPQRVDRDVMKEVFIPKGQWLFGGSLSYREYGGENLNYLILKDVQGHGYNLALSPCVGYFFKDNIAGGLRYSYNRTLVNVDNFQLNLGDDFNINLKNLYLLEQEYQASGFIRTYMPIGSGKIFGFFNEYRLTYGHSQGKNTTGADVELDGTFEEANRIQLGMAPGLTAFVTDFASVEVSIGIMGYNMEWKDQVTNQVETGSLKQFSGNFKINLFSLNIGLVFYL